MTPEETLLRYLFHGFDKVYHVIRPGGFEVLFFRRYRMHKTNPVGMQHLSFSFLYNLKKTIIPFGQIGHGFSGTIDPIADYGMPHGFAVHPDLMGTACFQINF